MTARVGADQTKAAVTRPQPARASGPVRGLPFRTQFADALFGSPYSLAVQSPGRWTPPSRAPPAGKGGRGPGARSSSSEAASFGRPPVKRQGKWHRYSLLPFSCVILDRRARRKQGGARPGPPKHRRLAVSHSPAPENLHFHLDKYSIVHLETLKLSIWNR